MEDVPLVSKAELEQFQDEDEKRNHVGEQIYSMIETWAPGQAEKITGMIIDQPIETLVETVSSQDTLKIKVDEARILLESE